jgi:molybdopterin molybdotransferase
MPDMAELIPIEQARRRVLDAVRPLAAEQVPLGEARGRVLAEDVTSAIDVPPFDPSAMDGFAVVAGPAAELRVIGESRAGHPADERVEPGTAIRISTGAMVPAGATAVVPIERVELLGAAGGGSAGNRGGGAPADGPLAERSVGDAGELVRVPQTSVGDHIRRRGEDVRAGDVLVRAGALLTPAAVGSLASIGVASAPCARRPRVALLVTGDELTPPGRPLTPGAIYSSNGYALAALVEQAGAVAVAPEAVPDSAEGTRAALKRALADADVVCVSGGVSVGPHDHVKAALHELGAEERFWGVALQPGKPTWFGVRDDVLAFGLPGNPVSAIVTFALFVRPALAALQCGDPDATRTSAILTEPVPRRPQRDQAVRVRLELRPDGWHATPTGPQGSHILSSLLRADALALIAAGPHDAPVGESVPVELL